MNVLKFLLHFTQVNPDENPSKALKQVKFDYSHHDQT